MLSLPQDVKRIYFHGDLSEVLRYDSSGHPVQNKEGPEEIKSRSVCVSAAEGAWHPGSSGRAAPGLEAAHPRARTLKTPAAYLLR